MKTVKLFEKIEGMQEGNLLACEGNTYVYGETNY